MCNLGHRAGSRGVVSNGFGENSLTNPASLFLQLYNEYADQANYYDLCLLIFHAAEYNNTRVILDTWVNLIEQTAYETEQRQAHWRLVRMGRPLPEGGAFSRAELLDHHVKRLKQSQCNIKSCTHESSVRGGGKLPRCHFPGSPTRDHEPSDQ